MEAENIGDCPAISERRCGVRAAASYPCGIFDHRGRRLASGRTADISERGAMLLVSGGWMMPHSLEVTVSLRLPGGPGGRVVRYICRVARAETIGRLLGVGIEFIRKLR